MYRGTQETDAPLEPQYPGRSRRYQNPKARFERHRHQECLDRMEKREQKVLLTKIFRIGSASDVLSEI